MIFGILGFAGQARVVDLTTTEPAPEEWNIVASGAGGPVGQSAAVRVEVHVSNCSIRTGSLYFSVGIVNNHEVDVAVPISNDPRRFSHSGAITFRQLIIELGTAANITDLSSFRGNVGLAPTVLFGDPSVPGTLSTLKPGERLEIRLRIRPRPETQIPSELRARIFGYDVTLAATEGGYRKIATWIPALMAISRPCRAEPEPPLR